MVDVVVIVVILVVVFTGADSFWPIKSLFSSTCMVHECNTSVYASMCSIHTHSVYILSGLAFFRRGVIPLRSAPNGMIGYFNVSPILHNSIFPIFFRRLFVSFGEFVLFSFRVTIFTRTVPIVLPLIDPV